MIYARQLHGRAVVDLENATKLGRIHELILDPDGRRIAALIVRHGDSVIGGGTDLTIPASAVHAIGPDAITVRRGADSELAPHLGTLPRLSHIVGRKVVSESGVLLGRVGDVLIASNEGRIFGYVLTDHSGPGGKLEAMFSGKGKHDGKTRYLRAEADLKPGKDLVVAPDDAIAVLDETPAHVETRAVAPPTPAPFSPSPQPVATAGATRWTDTPATARPASSAWTDRAADEDAIDSLP